MGNEEANEIAVLALRQVGCDLPEDCSIESFDTDTLVRTTSHCLHVLGNTEMAEYGKAALPSDMSSKFRVCTELAAAVKKLGYREEISFHLFLYPAEKSSRELVTFLMDRIPQAMRGGEGGGDMAGDKAIAMRNVTAALSAAAARMHVLPVCRPRTLRAAVGKPAGWAYPSVPLRTVALLVPPGEGGCSGYFDSEGLPAVTQQAWGPHGLAPSLFEANLLAQEKKKEINLDSSADDLAQAKAAFDKNIKEALRAASGKSKGKARDSIASLASLLEEWEQEDGLLALDTELTREERHRIAEEERMARLAREEEERQQMLADMQEELNKLNDLAELLAADYNLQLQRHRQVEADVEEETTRTEERIQEYKLKRKTLALLANRDENVAQLRRVSAEKSKDLLDLATEWERVRLPLVEDLRRRKGELLRRKEGMQWKIAKIKEMRESLVTLADAVRSKDELAKALELAKNMQKQKRDMVNILHDTRSIQADIATSWDTMKRSYGSVDEMIFRDARDKGDAVSKKMYKQLVATHECFASLCRRVENTGVLQNESRELERRLEQEGLRANVLNMQQVIKDLEEIKAENYALTQRVAELGQ